LLLFQLFVVKPRPQPTPFKKFEDALRKVLPVPKSCSSQLHEVALYR
jgi:hypothetical protein